MKKAIILMSGGLDSTVITALAVNQGRECLLLSFDYGQRHVVELEAAKKIASHFKLPHRIIKIDPETFGHSSLLRNQQGTTLEVPKNREFKEMMESKTPSTYVPARNTIFLSIALAQAEMFDADEIYIGPNKLDLKYPDCSENFIQAFQQVINLGTKKTCENKEIRIIAPLLKLDKREIIKLGLSLLAPLELSFSCYSPTETNLPCHSCDACLLRKEGFQES